MTEESRRASAGPGEALVHYDGQRWALSPGEEVTIGRSRSCGIHLPDDLHFSRHAGTLRVLGDCLLVRNDSRTKPLVIRPPYGEDRVVEPAAASTSLPFTHFDVVLAGSGGTVVSIRVDASRLDPGSGAEQPATRAPATAAAPPLLTAAQRRVLVALCAPLLSESGPRAAPATYAQIAEALQRQPLYIRNVVKTLRETLTGHGVPGLTREDAGPDNDDFRWTLARWAIRTGCVTAADVGGDDDDA